MSNKRFVTVTVSGNRIEAKLVKENALTVWVTIPGGNTIKRHKRKHQVEG